MVIAGGEVTAVGLLGQHRPAQGRRPERGLGLFKAPSLVNVWESPNYFHDARYGDLGEVIGHFDDYLGVGLSVDETAALIEYLKTL